MYSVATLVDVTSMIGDAPLTVTFSATPARFISALTVAVNPTAISMPVRVTVPNPVSSKTS